MSIPHDLLKQADYLITHDRGKPRQASLRRAISTAYYALFHLLTTEAASRFLTGANRGNIRILLQRSFGHSGMISVCRDIIKPNLPKKYDSVLSLPLTPKLINVATTFIDLQEARHGADYDLSKTVSRVDAMYLVRKTENAFADWNMIRKTLEADTFLILMLVAKKGNQQE